MNENYVKLTISTTVNGLDYKSDYLMSKELLMDSFSKEFVKNCAEILFDDLIGKVGTLDD